MRCMARNAKRFYYCLYKGRENIVDEEGYETGENRLVYSEPTECFGNISPATGSVQIQQFGTNEPYDRVIVMDDVNCPIDENSVLFVDIEPSCDENGRPQFDYVVKRVARSLNTVAYAISKVKTS